MPDAPKADYAAEAQWLNAAVEGDLDALSKLLERFGPMIRHDIRNKIGRVWQSCLDEDDVLQVTYLEAFLRIRQFVPDGVPAFISWLNRVAENNLRDAIRELERAKRPDPRRRVVVTSTEDSTIALLEHLVHTNSTPSLHLRRIEACDMLHDALAKLPPDYQAVVQGCDLDGKSAGDLAKSLDRSEGAVYMLRARAHERLRELLESSITRLSQSA